MKKKAKTPLAPKVISQNQIRYTITLALVLVIGLLVGMTGALLFRNNNPTILVWAADKDVKVPDGLVSYLERVHKNDCKDYKGTNSVVGVSLFSVYETAENRLAKMSYGCGHELTGADMYLLAIKKGVKWQLVPPTEYYLNLDYKLLEDGKWEGPTAAPSCDYLNENNIPVSFQSDCVDANGEYKLR